MGQNYLAVKQFLETHFVGIDIVEGGNFPVPLHGQIAGAIGSYIYLGGILLLLAGETIFAALGIPEPGFYVFMKNNKLVSGAALLFINSIGTKLSTTGAFEMYLNGEELFSKLKSGQFPDVGDIVNVLQEKGIKYIR